MMTRTVADIELDRISVRFDGGTALRDVTMSIDAGELVGVIGPSGSGKSTLLRAIAGIVPIADGRLYLGGVDVTRASSGARDTSMVFERPVLMPKRTVRRNISFPLEIRHQGATEIRSRVDAEVRALHIEALLERNPSELSHGEAQLVQIARAMVRVPRVLLLDEPFANLDVHVRARLRSEFRILQNGYGVTTVMTTNDVDDALTIPHRLAVLEHGQLVQMADPLDVQRRPATLSAAMATGPYSVPVVVTSEQGDLVLVGVDRHGDLPFRHRVGAPELVDRIGETVLLGVRPTDVVLAADGPVTAIVQRHTGPTSMVICSVAGGVVMASATRWRVTSGQRLNMRFDSVTVFDRSSEHAIVFV
jgi:multiple sugar transport system ATP-binding protein